jgi:secreted trypsin-like serine protease
MVPYWKTLPHLYFIAVLAIWSGVLGASIQHSSLPGIEESQVANSIRVINGVDVKDPNEYQFVADLSLHRDLVSSTRYCTGTLIQSDIVLTAAHCVLNHGEMGDGSFVTIGRLNLQDDHQSNSRSETFRAVAGYVHPDYQGLGSIADVALLLLDGSSSKKPVDLATTSPETNSTAWIVGYGIQAVGTVEGSGQSIAIMPKTLQKTALRIMDRGFCSGGEIETPKGMVCTAGVEGGASACRGDSGGGLFLQDSDGDKKQIGIVSYGDASCMSDNGGVFTDVSAVHEWIREGIARLHQLPNTHQLLTLKKGNHNSLLPTIVHSGSTQAYNQGNIKFHQTLIMPAVKFFRIRSDTDVSQRVLVSVCTKRTLKDARLALVNDIGRNVVRNSFMNCNKEGYVGHRISFDGWKGTDTVTLSTHEPSKGFEIRVEVKNRDSLGVIAVK